MKTESQIAENLQWTPDLEIGIAVIDNQHKRIVAYINELNDAIRTGNTEETKLTLEGLLDYTITHFEFEEELQEKAGYPFLKAHQKVHQMFMKRIAKFRGRANNGEDIAQELLGVLKVWLVSHIKGDDRDYGESVREFINSTNKEHGSWLNSTLKKLFG
jgi:hemerythrin